MIDSSCQPSLYQIDTRIWLAELGCFSRKDPALDAVPDQTLDEIAGHGFDWVWMTGIWQTGQAGRQIAAGIPELRQEIKRILPDFTEEDICGSPFAVQSYHVHHNFGGNEALKRFRERLSQRGLRLLLDFVPNHTAIDHPWVNQHPEYYIQGTQQDLDARPMDYIRLQTGRGVRFLAHGRDPYFPPWSDTLQLNYRHPELRRGMISELEHIAGMCDGVRCDMAMLLLPEVILRTWRDQSLPLDGSLPVDDPFWLEAIPQVKKQHPDFVFIAEVYWDLEPRLQEQGFDYTYDKHLYDHLRARAAWAVRQILSAKPDYQRRLVRFLENHDELRAAFAFPDEIGRAAAVLCYLAPGLRFFHHGQLEGRRIRLPVQICRPPVEELDEPLHAFYAALLALLKRKELRCGAWRLLECQPYESHDPSWSNIIACAWHDSYAGTELLVLVNFSSQPARCAIQPWEDEPSPGISFTPLLTSPGEGVSRWQTGRLSFDLPAWGFQVVEVHKA
jgi:Alpha amylase, catalytic domain